MDAKYSKDRDVAAGATPGTRQQTTSGPCAVGTSHSPAPRHTQTTACQSNKGFFELNRELREKIYKMVLSLPQPLYIFQDRGAPVSSFAPDKPPRWLALLATSRQLREEACSFLYGANHFNLVDNTSRQRDILQAFLTGIGTHNAASIKHLSIGFPAPVLDSEISGQVDAGSRNLGILQLVKDHCPAITFLEAFVQRQTIKAIAPTADVSLARQPLLQVNEQVKAISSLKSFTVQLYCSVPDQIVDAMKELGWVVQRGL